MRYHARRQRHWQLNYWLPFMVVDNKTENAAALLAPDQAEDVSAPNCDIPFVLAQQCEPDMFSKHIFKNKLYIQNKIFKIL